MVDFIMLGQIPGTSLQISFAAWLVMALVTGLALLAWRHKNWREQTLGQFARLSQRWQRRRLLKRLDQIAL